MNNGMTNSVQAWPAPLLKAAVLGCALLFESVLGASGQRTPAGTHFPLSTYPPADYSSLQSGTTGQPAWTQTIHHPGATYIAVRFSSFDLGPGDVLRVKDAASTQVQLHTGRKATADGG